MQCLPLILCILTKHVDLSPWYTLPLANIIGSAKGLGLDNLTQSVQTQSTRNWFELRRTFCPANLQSFAGHFECSLDISLYKNVQRLVIYSPDIVFDLLSPVILSGDIKLLRRTFFKIRRTCPVSPANFAYSARPISSVREPIQYQTCGKQQVHKIKVAI